MYIRDFLELLNCGGKIHVNCGQHCYLGWGHGLHKKESRAQMYLYFLTVAEYDPLLHTLATVTSYLNYELKYLLLLKLFLSHILLQ